MTEEIFTIKIDYDNPIELSDFSESLVATADQFHSHIIEEKQNINEDQIKLYICEIEKGSIIAKIKALGEHAGTTINGTNILDGFLSKTKNVVDYFLGNIDIKPELNINELQNYKKILQPAASDKGTSLSFNVEEGGIQTINLTINHVEANAAQNRINHEIGLLKLPENSIRHKVLFYCYQARNDKKSKTGDMGIIENIDSSPVKTIYMDESIKEQILKNPFDVAYIVDVDVHTINRKAKLYKVLKIYDVVDQ